ncbi:putative SSC1-mitochondrial HSP70 member [Mycena indigotica]|uniref:Putative SSC1-mitochondrial HSP70 member n=1 Tax=Mycena indigotica TaxID=2126181 RepID=A0A8H6VTQ9_9AGAR|nr:putative SSC1-mitochondrial HSP70 member [Mycena indigotica]KAF7293612.1 putative SSC1-mitochondrial HSP70 member [Mycena indigotica]
MAMLSREPSPLIPQTLDHRIDLGTTNSCACAEMSCVIENSEGARTTPSVVAFAKHGERLVGLPAKRQAVVHATNTVFAFKRLIGRQFTDKEVADDRRPQNTGHLSSSASVTAGQLFPVEYDGGKKTFSAEELPSMVLTKMKETAEQYLNQKVNHAVITVPAHFNDAQRQATKDAGQIAGLNVLRVINEPTAAALAYGLDKDSKAKIVVVCDLGGGTFDISIIEMPTAASTKSSPPTRHHLGDEGFDILLVDHILKEFKSEHGIDLNGDRMAIQRIREAAAKAKIELSSTAQTEINLPFITADATGPKHINTKLLHSQFEALTSSLIQRTVARCKKALSDAGVKPSDVHQVILVGGMTRIETLGSIMTISSLATRPSLLQKSQVFSTAADRETAIEVKIYQGECELVVNNKLLGNFNLVGIPPAPKGVSQIEITFDIDADGIVNVSAKDKATRRDQSITILDKERRDLIKLSNKANSFCVDTENSVNEFKDQLDTAIKTKMDETQVASLGFQKLYEKKNAEHAASSEAPAEERKDDEKKESMPDVVLYCMTPNLDTRTLNTYPPTQQLMNPTGSEAHV